MKKIILISLISILFVPFFTSAYYCYPPTTLGFSSINMCCKTQEDIEVIKKVAEKVDPDGNLGIVALCESQVASYNNTPSIPSYTYTPPTSSYSNYKAFAVFKKFSNDIIVVDRDANVYQIDYNYDCYDSDFEEGEVIAIKTYFSPGSGDKIITKDMFGRAKSCEVFSSEGLNLKDYLVTDVIDSKNQIIVEDKQGNKYLVEYGVGCLSMWRYENKWIAIDIGGAFLDGISDRIYLLDTDDECKVWDAKELKSDPVYVPIYITPQRGSQPEQEPELRPVPEPKTLGASYSENNPLNLEPHWLIKNKKFIEVFYVDENLCLHWIINEQVAERRFGVTWNYERNIKEFDNIPRGYKFCDHLE